MPDERLAATPRARRALAELAGRPLNFDPAELASAGPGTGWHVDDYHQPLPAEPPGEPVAGGCFEIARRLMSDYAFADPAIVRAMFDPAAGLANRNMLLQVRFGPLRFLLACRVGAVADETRTEDGRAVRIWGWSYGTLAGHFERGQMDFTVRKWLDDGSVEFRIHVVSRRARAGNPLVRLGLRLLGRREQVRFASRACERMDALVARELDGAAGAAGAGSATPAGSGAATGPSRPRRRRRSRRAGS
jgi:uncharacterized protein (UPF0548 family)